MSLAPVSYLPLSLMQQNMVDFFEANINLLWSLSDELPEEERVWARDEYNNFEEAEDKRYDTIAKDRLARANVEFKTINRHYKLKNLDKYRETKDRSQLQIECVVFHDEVMKRFKLASHAIFKLRQTTHRWLKIFLSVHDVPEVEHKSLARKIRKECTDIEIFQEDHGIGGGGRRSHFGRYSNRVVEHLETESLKLFEKYGLKFERGKMEQIGPILSRMNVDERTYAVKLLFKQAMSDLHGNLHFFLQGGAVKIAMLCKYELRAVIVQKQQPHQVSGIFQSMATHITEIELAARASKPPLDVGDLDENTISSINTIATEFITQMKIFSQSLRDFLFLFDVKNAHPQYVTLYRMTAEIFDRLLKTQNPESREACVVS